MKDPCKECADKKLYNISSEVCIEQGGCDDYREYQAQQDIVKGYLTGLAEGIEIGLQAGMEIALETIYMIFLEIYNNDHNRAEPISLTWGKFKEQLAAELRQEK